MTQENSKPNRLYTRFISILRIIQYLGYFVIVVFSSILGFFTVGGPAPSAFPPLALVIILLQATIGCSFVYVVTQGLIAIVDLLSRIEQNTRPL